MDPVKIALVLASCAGLGGCAGTGDCPVADAARQLRDGRITADDFRERLVCCGESAVPDMIPLLVDDALRLAAMHAICVVEKDTVALRPMLWDAPLSDEELRVKAYGAVAGAITRNREDLRAAYYYDVIRLARDGRQPDAVALLIRCWKDRAGLRGAGHPGP